MNTYSIEIKNIGVENYNGQCIAAGEAATYTIKANDEFSAIQAATRKAFGRGASYNRGSQYGQNGSYGQLLRKGREYGRLVIWVN